MARRTRKPAIEIVGDNVAEPITRRDRETLADVVDSYRDGHTTRRRFIVHGTALGLSLTSLSAVLAACAKLTAEPEGDGSWRISASFSRLIPSTDDSETDFAAVFAGQIAVSHLVPVGRPSVPPPPDIDDLLAALAPDRPVASII